MTTWNSNIYLLKDRNVEKNMLKICKTTETEEGKVMIFKRKAIRNIMILKKVNENE